MEINGKCFLVFLLLLCINWGVVLPQDNQDVCKGSEEKPKDVLVQSLKKSPEVDVIFLMDRSDSIRKSNFNKSRFLMQQILQKYYVVHPNFARVSVIMYSTNVIVALDHIHTPLISCKLFEKINNSVIFEKAIGDGTELTRALKKALKIFQSSARTNASKVLWLLADGQKEDSTKSYYTQATAMKHDLGVQIFAVGIGKQPNGWYTAKDEAVMKELASNVEHYACLDQWLKIVEEVFLANDISGYGDRVWHSVNDEADTYCGDSCDKNNQCYCNASSISSSCTCPPQYYPDGDSNECIPCPTGYCKILPGFSNCTADQCPPPKPTSSDPLDDHFFNVFGISITMKWFIVIIAVLVALIIIIIIICVACCCWCRKKRGKKEKKEGEVNMAMSTIPVVKSDTLESQRYVTHKTATPKRPAPPPPKLPPQTKDLPPDYDDVIYGTVQVDMTTLSKQKLHEGMEGWPDYMTAGVEARQLSGMYISTLDNSRWARTPHFRIKHSEILQVAALMDNFHNQKGYDYMQITLQGKKYAVHENNGTVLEGRGPIGGRSENVICAASNGDYIIVGKAPAEYDRGDCQMEVLRVLGHFQQYDQSYSTLN